MRKLVVQEWLSVDGFAADENGSTDFLGPSEDHLESDQEMLANMKFFDLILLGANTYSMFVEFWPTEQARNEIMAEWINETPKTVCSNSLKNISWGKWDNATQQKGDAIEAIKKLKQQKGKEMILWGSLSLARSLLDADVVDEIRIGNVPIILGKGIRLFGESDQIKLQTTERKTYDNGITQINYTRK